MFNLVCGEQCTKTMKNRLEKLGNFETIETANNVVELLKAIKVEIFDANERKHPSLRMALLWKKLAYCKQHDNEDLIDHCKRFVGLIEMFEIAYSNIRPEDDKERSKFIAMMFLDGVDKKLHGYLLKDSETDCSLRNKGVYPESIEDALQVLIMFSEKKLRKKGKGKTKEIASSVQTLKCWYCGEEGHSRKTCPKLAAKKKGKKTEEAVDLFEGCVPAWMSGADIKSDSGAIVVSGFKLNNKHSKGVCWMEDRP